MVIMRNSSTGSPHFAQSNFVRQKSLGVRFLKQTNTTKYYYAKDMPVSPRRHIGVAQYTTTAYPT
jgi:hypothetical protein